MTEPLVTVIIPTHNHRAFIAEAIESALMQETTFPFSILLHDDASTDGTADVCRAYADRYPEKIELILQTVNQYQFDRRIQSHILFPRVKAKYTAILDGDDYWTDKSKLQRQVTYLEAHPESALCICATDKVDFQGRVLGAFAPYACSRAVDPNDMIRKGGSFCSSCSIVAPTAALNAMPPFTMQTEVEDIPVQLWCALQGEAWYIARSMVAYRCAVPGSWTTRQHAADIETRMETHRSVKQLLVDFDAYTEGRYHDAFDEAIRYQEFSMLCLTHDIMKARRAPYRMFWRELTRRRRLRLWLEKLFPRLSAACIGRVRAINGAWKGRDGA